MAGGQQQLIIKDLGLGLVTSPPAYKLAPGEARSLHNLFINLRGSVKLRGRLRYPANLSAFSSSVYITGFIRYRTGTSSYIVFGRRGGGGDGTWAYNEQTGVFSLISSLILDDAVVMDDRVIFAQLGADYPYWWNGSGTASPLGLAPPTSVMTAAANGVGTLQNVDLPAYQWFVTFVNAIGVESNPTQLLTPGGGPSGSNTLAGVDNKSVNLTNIPTGPVGVADRYIYRVGGLLSRPALVQTLGNNTTVTTNDNTGDQFVGTVFLSNSHDQPPTAIQAIAKVKNRLLLGKGTTLYVSNLAEPDYFPDTVTFPSTDGIIFTMDNDLSNPIVAISESGSAGVIHRSRGAWLLQGEDIDTFTLTKVCDIGILARRTAVMCGNVYTWQSPDSMVWVLTSDGPQPIGLDIETDLAAIPQSERAFACAAYHNRSYHLCIPRAPGTLPFYRVYSFVYNKWVDLSEQFVGATQLYSELGEVDVDEMLFATKSGYQDYWGATTSGNRGIAAQFGPSGITNFGFEFWTGDFDADQPSLLKKATDLKVWGTWTPSGNQQGYAEVNAIKERRDGTQQTITRLYALRAGGPGSRLDTDLDAALNGQRMNVRLFGSGDAAQLDALLLDYTMERQGRL